MSSSLGGCQKEKGVLYTGKEVTKKSEGNSESILRYVSIYMKAWLISSSRPDIDIEANSRGTSQYERTLLVEGLSDLCSFFSVTHNR
jgi:hypothetical protein